MRYLALGLLVLLAACRPPEPVSSGSPGKGLEAGGIRVSLELAGAPAVGPAVVRVYLLSSDNEAVADAAVSVTGTMTHAGMEPISAEAEVTEEGFYTTQGFEFDMAGDWLLEAEVTLADGTTAQDELSVTVPGS